MGPTQRTATQPVDEVADEVEDDFHHLEHHGDGDSEVEGQLASDRGGGGSTQPTLSNCTEESTGDPTPHLVHFLVCDVSRVEAVKVDTDVHQIFREGRFILRGVPLFSSVSSVTKAIVALSLHLKSHSSFL